MVWKDFLSKHRIIHEQRFALVGVEYFEERFVNQGVFTGKIRKHRFHTVPSYYLTELSCSKYPQAK